jgi:hypothetical protein
MINFNLNIANPWSRCWNLVFCKFGPIGQYKAWEFNVYNTHYLIDLEFRLAFTGDHPGVFVTFGLLGYSLEVNLYDIRHGDMR